MLINSLEIHEKYIYLVVSNMICSKTRAFFLNWILPASYRKKRFLASHPTLSVFCDHIPCGAEGKLHKLDRDEKLFKITHISLRKETGIVEMASKYKRVLRSKVSHALFP